MVETIFDQAALDDAPILVRRLKLASGQNSKDEPDAIRDDEIEASQNADLSSRGVRGTRGGRVAVGTSSGTDPVLGLAKFFPEGGTRVLTRMTGGIWQTWDGTTGWTNIQTGLVSGLRTNFVVGGKRIFMLNGNNNVHTYDGTTVTDEGNTNTDPPISRFGIYHQNRVILSGNNTDRSFFFFSDVLATQTFDRAANVHKVQDQDNDIITALVNMSLTTNHGFVVFKEKSTHFVDSSGTVASWPIVNIDSIHGCHATRTAVVISTTGLRGTASDIFYLSKEGAKYRVRSLIRTIDDAIHASGVLSNAIEDILEDVNNSQMEDASAFFFDEKYFLSIPSGASAINDTVCVLDLRTSIPEEEKWNWTIFKGWQIESFENFEENNVEHIYGADSSANTEVFRLLNGTNDSGSVSIEFIEEGRREDLDLPELDKNFEHVEVHFLATDNLATVSAQIDGNGYSVLGTVDLSGGGPTLPIDLPFFLGGQARIIKKFPLDGLGPGRNCQIRVEQNVLDQTVRYLGYIIAAFPIPLNLGEPDQS